MNFHESISRYFSAEELTSINKVKVGIAGAGGLGSNCAMNLVRSGFVDFTIADFDIIDGSNLNRQFFFIDQIGSPKVSALRDNLLKINPALSVTASNERIDAGNIDFIFAECHCIIEAFDDPVSKTMLIEHFSHSEKLVVAASGIAGHGNTDRIITRKINPTLYIVGDLISESSDSLPPYSPGVTIAAAKQADIILTNALNGFFDNTSR